MVCQPPQWVFSMCSLESIHNKEEIFQYNSSNISIFGLQLQRMYQYWCYPCSRTSHRQVWSVCLLCGGKQGTNETQFAGGSRASAEGRGVHSSSRSRSASTSFRGVGGNNKCGIAPVAAYDNAHAAKSATRTAAQGGSQSKEYCSTTRAGSPPFLALETKTCHRCGSFSSFYEIPLH